MVAPKSGLNKNRGLTETDWTATYIFKYFYCNYLNILNLLLLRSKFIISSTSASDHQTCSLSSSTAPPQSAGSPPQAWNPFELLCSGFHSLFALFSTLVTSCSVLLMVTDHGTMEQAQLHIHTYEGLSLLQVLLVV